MPKKVHGRSAPKARTRQRSPQPRTMGTPTHPPVSQDELIPSVGSTTATATQPSSIRPSAASTATRRPVPGRRTPALSTNYANLRGDIRMLSMLAPAMVVLLLIAFFVFH